MLLLAKYRKYYKSNFDFCVNKCYKVLCSAARMSFSFELHITYICKTIDSCRQIEKYVDYTRSFLCTYSNIPLSTKFHLVKFINDQLIGLGLSMGPTFS